MNQKRMNGENSFNNDYESCEETEDLTRYELRNRSKLKKPTVHEDYEMNFMSLIEDNEPQIYRSHVWKRIKNVEKSNEN